MLAAALAVGVGVAAALTKAQLRRRSERKREARWKLKRLTLKHIDSAIELLEGRGEVAHERTIHETRKALKRARALVRLQRGALGAKCFARANAALRNCGRQLASARDAEVVLDTLDRIVERHPKRLKRSPGVARFRAQLLAERARAHAHMHHGAHVRAAVLGELRTTRLELERWQPAQGDRKTARQGLERIYRQGRERRRRARKANSSKALHDWRKRVKDLRYAAEALGLRKVAKRADLLGETIGAEHDLWLLDRCLRGQRRCFRGDKAARKELSTLIARRRRRLRKRAFTLGSELYREPPKRFVRRCLES